MFTAFFSTTKCIFFIEDKELLVPLIPSLKSLPDSLVETLRCYSGCQMDYLQWKIFRIKGRIKKKVSCVCKQEYNPSFIYVLKKKSVKHLISHGSPLMLILRGPQEAKENQLIIRFISQCLFWPRVFCALHLIVKHLAGFFL